MDDPTLEMVDGVALVRLVPYRDHWPEDDADANFRVDVATYSSADPLSTIRRLGRTLDIPVGALVRYVLAKWATGGSEALLELGPSTVDRLRSVVAEAEDIGTDEARLAAWETVRAMVEWLAHGLEDPDRTYPDGGASVGGR